MSIQPSFGISYCFCHVEDITANVESQWLKLRNFCQWNTSWNPIININSLSETTYSLWLSSTFFGRKLIIWYENYCMKVPTLCVLSLVIFLFHFALRIKTLMDYFTWIIWLASLILYGYSSREAIEGLCWQVCHWGWSLLGSVSSFFSFPLPIPVHIVIMDIYNIKFPQGFCRKHSLHLFCILSFCFPSCVTSKNCSFNINQHSFSSAIGSR